MGPGSAGLVVSHPGMCVRLVASLGVSSLLFLGCANKVFVEGTAGSSGSVASSSSSGAGGSVTPPLDLCSLRCTEPVAEGALQNPEVTETSGLIASDLFDGIYYLHNDSGDGARFFATDLAGADLGTFTVAGAGAVDWEDAAAGPCGNGGSCLYWGDIGDNPESRPGITVYRVAEPTQVGLGADQVLEAEAFELVYEDGPHDAEAMVIDPSGPRIIVIIKDAVTGAVAYGSPVPLTEGSPMVLSPVADFELPEGLKLITGAEAFGEDGILVRSYAGVFYYPRPVGGELLDAFGQPGCVLPRPIEMQGEAVAPLPLDEGGGFVTIAEGSGAAVNVVRCKP